MQLVLRFMNLELNGQSNYKHSISYTTTVRL